MGNFRENSRGGFSRGNRSSGNRGGFGRPNDRRPTEMHDATCSTCGRACQVPFRPTGSKPVLCSDCFRKNDSESSNFSPRNQDRPAQSGVSIEQFNQINTKLDKILEVLEDLEIMGDDSEDSEKTEDDEDSDDDSDQDKSENDSK